MKLPRSSPDSRVGNAQPQPFSSSTATEQTNVDASASKTNSSVAREIFAANVAKNKVPARGTKSNRVTGPSYKPSGRIGDLGLPLLMLWPLIAGVVIGYGYWLFSQQWNPLFFSQILLGLALGLAMLPAIRLGKCRNTRAAIASAIATSLIAFLLWHGLQARQLRTDYVGYITSLGVKSKIPEVQARAKAEQFLTPDRTARLYLKERTVNGVTLREDSGSTLSNSASGSGTHIVGLWYWVLEAFELVIVALMASVVAQNIASNRFSEERDNWYRKKVLCAVQPTKTRALLRLMQAGQWREAGALARSSTTQNGYTVTIYDCAPASNGIVTVTQGVNKQTHHLFEAEVSQENIALLRHPN